MSDLVTITVPALPAAAQITGNELVPVHQNGRLVRVRQTELTRGGAAFVERVAAAAMTKGTVVVSAGLQMIPADPYDTSHYGRVLGILAQDVAVGVTALVQAIGTMTEIFGAFAGDDNLFPGPSGSLVNAVPAGAKWRQQIGRADTASAITITLGEASLIQDGDALILSSGGFASVTSYSRPIVEAADAIAARSQLGLGSIAQQDAANVTVSGGTIDGTVIGKSSPAQAAFVSPLVNRSTTPKTNSGIAFDATDACPADAYGVAPPSGFVPGDHLRAGSAWIFQTQRDNDCQEVGLHVELHNVTGAHSGAAGYMNDGKTCFGYAVAGYPGGGQMWGIAGTTTLKPGYTGKFVAANEIDLNNNAYNSFVGNTSGNVCGIFQNGISEYMSLAAHWITGTVGQSGGYFFDLGTFYQESSTRLIRTACFFDDTNAGSTLIANSGKTHANGTIVDKSAGLTALDVQGNKSDSFIWTRGIAPIGLKLQGTVSDDSIQINDGSKNAVNVIGSHSVSGLNTSNATVPYSVVAGTNQKIKLGPFAIYSDGNKLYVMNESNQTLIASIDGNGVAKFLGGVSQGAP
ncbi:hypothetical protein MMB17_07550 [Methylobacterium organophilum]|uniref:hypothetical protein n=1 Tax=Methylobacterium organophilum TaxID=410 RepID=UPI001F144CEF|nr:hypothetical protein [Methylobacterium organophilum]UMY19145.1 hypothetical protein MMB17_07550 [Methylobacterium organophilum]